MPPPLDVDKEAVRVLVLAIGVREAARRMNLPEATVQAWSARGNWLQPTRPQPATMPKPASQVSATIATKPAFALQNVMAEDSSQTKLALSKYALKVAQHAQALDPELAMNAAPLVHSSAKTAALAHSWSDRSQLNLNVSIYADRPQELPAEARVIDAEEC